MLFRTPISTLSGFLAPIFCPAKVASAVPKESNGDIANTLILPPLVIAATESSVAETAVKNSVDITSTPVVENNTKEGK